MATLVFTLEQYEIMLNALETIKKHMLNNKLGNITLQELVITWTKNEVTVEIISPPSP